MINLKRLFCLFLTSNLFALQGSPVFSVEIAQEELSQAPSAQLTIQKIVFVGYTAFSEDELEAVVSEFKGKPVNLDTIQEIAKTVAQFYQNEGYLTSDAYPLVDISQGIIRIQIVEGQLEDIRIEGAKNNPNANFLKNWLFSKAGKPLNVKNLLSAIEQLQISPNIETIQAELKEGSRTQFSILEVTVTEAPNYEIELGVDNYGALSSGQEEGAAGLRVNSLSGRGDRLEAQIQASEGSKQALIDYQLPICFLDCVSRLHYEIGSSRVVEEPFERFDIEGDYQKAFFEWRQFLTRRASREVSVAAQVGWQKSQTSILGQKVSFLLQVPDEGYEIYTLRLSSLWRENWQTGALAIGGELTLGWDSLSSSSDPFVIFRGQANWIEKLNDSLLISVFGSFQVSESSLEGTAFGILPSEQFPIGGLNTVPGYDLYLLQGDSGINFRIDLQQGIFESPDWGMLIINPYVAYGKVWNESVSLLETTELASLGANLVWSIDGWEISVGAAIPLSDVPEDLEQTTYVSVRKRFAF